jgi:copper chaperone CopZ
MSDPIILKVEGMGCQACVAAVEKAVKGKAPSASVSVNLAEGTVSISDAAVARDVLAAAIIDAGYDVIPG